MFKLSKYSGSLAIGELKSRIYKSATSVLSVASLRLRLPSVMMFQSQQQQQQQQLDLIVCLSGRQIDKASTTANCHPTTTAAAAVRFFDPQPLTTNDRLPSYAGGVRRRALLMGTSSSSSSSAPTYARFTRYCSSERRRLYTC